MLLEKEGNDRRGAAFSALSPGMPMTRSVHVPSATRGACPAGNVTSRIRRPSGAALSSICWENAAVEVRRNNEQMAPATNAYLMASPSWQHPWQTRFKYDTNSVSRMVMTPQDTSPRGASNGRRDIAGDCSEGLERVPPL